MDPGESAEECAIRELKEETGYVGKVIEGSFGVSPVMFNGKRNRCRKLRPARADDVQIRASATRTSR